MVNSFLSLSALQNKPTQSANLCEEFSEFFYYTFCVVYDQFPTNTALSHAVESNLMSGPLLVNFNPISLKDS